MIAAVHMWHSVKKKECLNRGKDTQLQLHKNEKYSSVKKNSQSEKAHIKVMQICTTNKTEKRMTCVLYKELL